MSTVTEDAPGNARRATIEELDALIRRVGLAPGAGAANAARRIDRQTARLEHRIAALQARGPQGERAASRLLTKVRQLRQQRRDVLASPVSLTVEERGAHARLRKLLHDELVDVRATQAPDGPLTARWLQGRAAQLLRARRTRLEDAERSLRVALSYVLRARSLVRRHESGEDGAEPFEVSRWLGMAALALREAHAIVRQLGEGWPDVATLARQRDWMRMPFAQLRTEIERTASLAEIDAEELGALALWLGELAERTGRLPVETP